MKKTLLFLLVIISAYLLVSLYFLDKVAFLCPIAYKRDFIIRSDSRGDGFFAADRSGRRTHNGLDLLADIGKQVLAARSGIVTVCEEKKNGMGNYIALRHPYNIVTVYGHLSKIYVAKNEVVRQGQVIGRVGKTGNANYPDIRAHLHFEVRKNGVPQDPLEYLQ